MSKEDELLKVYEKAKKGSRDNYEYLCTLLFEEVYKMVALVYDKEENRKKLVNHIFNKMKTRLNEFQPEIDDIHRWVCVFAVKTMYFVYSAQKGELFSYKEENAAYEISYVEDDPQLADCAARYNDEIAEGYLDKDSSAFGTLTKGQIILYELFCYAGCTVEEIEDLIEVDSIYILSELADIKTTLYTSAFGEGWEFRQDEQQEPEEQAEESGEDIAAAYGKTSVKAQYDNQDEDEEDAIAGIFKRIPKKVMQIAALGTVAAILVIILVVVLAGGKKNKNTPIRDNQNSTTSASGVGNDRNPSSPADENTNGSTENTGSAEDNTGSAAQQPTTAAPRPTQPRPQPTNPASPTQPTQPENPTEPTQPENPTEATQPENPTDPENPTESTGGEENPTESTGGEENPTESTGGEENPTDPENPTESTGGEENPTSEAEPNESAGVQETNEQTPNEQAAE